MLQELASNPAAGILAGGGIGYALRELRLYRRDRDNHETDRVEQLFERIVHLEGRVEQLSISNAQLAAAKAALEVELSLVIDERNALRRRVDVLEARIGGRRDNDDN